MKKLILLVTAFVLVISLSACSDVCVGPECLGATSGGDSEGYEDGMGEAIPFVHINGEGHEEDQNAIILMEYNKLSDYVIYQVTYLSCTCRAGTVNFWNTVYLHVNKDDGAIRLISWHYDADSDGNPGHYYAATWGDSSGADEQGGVTLEDLEADYFPWFIGKTFADLDGLTVYSNGEMHGFTNTSSTQFDQDSVDAFADSTVSTNNFLRMIVELLRYHEEKY